MTDGVAVVRSPTDGSEAVSHDEWEGSSSPIGTAVLASKEWGGITAVDQTRHDFACEYGMIQLLAALERARRPRLGAQANLGRTRCVGCAKWHSGDMIGGISCHSRIGQADQAGTDRIVVRAAGTVPCVRELASRSTLSSA